MKRVKAEWCSSIYYTAIGPGTVICIPVLVLTKRAVSGDAGCRHVCDGAQRRHGTKNFKFFVRLRVWYLPCWDGVLVERNTRSARSLIDLFKIHASTSNLSNFHDTYLKYLQ